MEFMTRWGILHDRRARPDKGRLRGKLTEEELEKLLAASYVRQRALIPGT
jgi:hypothetical protein